MSQSKIIIAILLLCLPFTPYAQNSRVEELLTEFKNDGYLKQSKWGLMVRNTNSGNTIASYNADTMLIPASTTKIFSTAAALHYLTDTFSFRTHVYTTGIITAEGVLEGDLIIVGGADPSFGNEKLSPKSGYNFVGYLVQSLTSRGIKKIRGNIIGYGGLFGNEIIPASYPEDDRGNYYGAGSAALMYDSNRLEFKFRTGTAVGSPVVFLGTNPVLDSLTLINEVTTGKTGTADNSLIWGEPFEWCRKITGELPPSKSSFSVYGSSPDPILSFLTVLMSQLKEANISIEGDKVTMYQNATLPPKAELLCVYTSPELESILAYTNTYSNNIYAETLLRTSGLKNSGDASYRSGCVATETYAAQLGIDTARLELYDGSGLSKSNRISPLQLVSFLDTLQQTPYFSAFYNSLPIAGKTGTLTTLFQGTYAAGKLRAKSGYMKTVRAYAGYVLNPKGDIIAFAIIVNHYPGNGFVLKKKLEEFLVAVSQSE